jgi:hypothetical protein
MGYPIVNIPDDCIICHAGYMAWKWVGWSTHTLPDYHAYMQLNRWMNEEHPQPVNNLGKASGFVLGNVIYK